MSETKKALNSKDKERQLFIEDIPFKGRTIRIVGVEHEKAFLKRGVTPEDWLEKVSGAIADASVVFVEYFPPELERTVYNIAFLGKAAQAYARYSNTDVFFNAIANKAAELNKPVAVADIANKPLYLIYEYLHLLIPYAPGLEPVKIPLSLSFVIQHLFSQGHLHPKTTKVEKVFPMATDARRLINALALTQEAMERTEGSKIVYIGPPAHANRMSDYIKNGLSPLDKIRNFSYRFMIGLDKSRRVYKKLQSGDWIEISNIPVKH